MKPRVVVRFDDELKYEYGTVHLGWFEIPTPLLLAMPRQAVSETGTHCIVLGITRRI